MLAEAAAEEAAAAAALGVRRVGAVEDLRCLEENLDSNIERKWVAIHCASPPCSLSLHRLHYLGTLSFGRAGPAAHGMHWTIAPLHCCAAAGYSALLAMP